MKMLSLDPATHYTGYAVWETGRIITTPLRMDLIQYGVLRAAKDDWDIRCLELNAKIRNLIVEQEMSLCVSEFPEFQSGKRGMDAARAGDTLKLAYLCGSLACGWQLYAALHLADTQHKIRGVSEGSPTIAATVTWIRPSQWKGQLPKEITVQRCNARYGFLATSEIEKNISDAIMIGDWWLHKMDGMGTHPPGTGPERRKDY